MKNIYFVLLPLASFVAVVTSQSRSQACSDSVDALLNDETCYSATLLVESYLTGNDVAVTRGDLNGYCSSTCREIYLQVSANCADEPTDRMADSAAINLVCTINGDVNCIDLLRSSQLAAVNNALEPIVGDCGLLEFNGTCSADCAVVVENFINYGECCVVELIEFERNHGDFDIPYDQLLAFCNINDPGFASCQVINGAGRLSTITYGGLLLVTAVVMIMF